MPVVARMLHWVVLDGMMLDRRAEKSLMSSQGMSHIIYNYPSLEISYYAYSSSSHLSFIFSQSDSLDAVSNESDFGSLALTLCKIHSTPSIGVDTSTI